MELNVEPSKLGERLRLARSAVGLTQQDVANELKMARTTLVAIEAGERVVRPEELLELAKLYKSDVHSLVRTTAVHVDLVGQFRQSAAHAKDEKAARQAVQLLHRLATSAVELERKLGRPLKPSYPSERPVAKSRLDQQAEDLAQELRNRLGLGQSPITDLASIIELELGVRVFIASLPSHISGVFAFHDELGACIIHNAKHPPARRAWTLAHELAHFLTSRSTTAVVYDHVDRSDSREVFANLFANAFLMPGPALRRAVADWSETSGKFSTRHLILLAHRFHVSVEAMCRRLEQLDLLLTGTFESLKRKGLNKQIEHEVEQDVEILEPTRPSRLSVLGVEAYARGILSEGQLGEMLALDRVETRRLVELLADDTDLLEGRK